MALSRLCLDTSAYGHFMRGHAAAIDAIDRASWIGIPTVTIGELRTGFLLGSRTDRNERELQTLVEHPATEILVIDEDTAIGYAELVVDLRHAGTPLPTNDIWIAAAALRHGATIITYDEHFSAITRVGTLILGAD